MLRRAEAREMPGRGDNGQPDEAVLVPGKEWPERPTEFNELLTPVEAAQYLRLDETGAHTPESAIRSLNFWRGKGELRATKYARRVWYRRTELDRFLERKTEA
jgi:hypothetical protein